MADTIITPSSRDYDSSGNSAGWAVAFILLLGLLLLAVFVWPGMRAVVPSTTQTPASDINVDVQLPQGAMPTTDTGKGIQNQQGTQNPGTGNTQTQ